MLVAPTEKQLLIQTQRLTLEPITIEHASLMAVLLSDLELYTYVPQDPPNAGSLKKTYQLWSQRVSPDGKELWLNWAARFKETKQLVGHFQVGYKDPKNISIAYTVGKKFQRKGLALEALEEIIRFLKHNYNAQSVSAWIDTRNTPSINLAKKLNMKQVAFLEKADYFKGSPSDEYVYCVDFS